MKNRHIIPILGLVCSTALGAALVIYVLARPLAKWTDIAESTINSGGLALLFSLNVVRLLMILNDRDVASNLINARLQKEQEGEAAHKDV